MSVVVPSEAAPHLGRPLDSDLTAIAGLVTSLAAALH